MGIWRFRYVIVAFLLAMRCFDNALSHWYKGFIPASLEINETVVIDDTWIVSGVAVFRVAPRTLEQIRMTGLRAFADANIARDHNQTGYYFAYSQWKETPYRISGDGHELADRWLRAFVYAKIGWLDQSIRDAIETPGSYYAVSSDSGLIIIPSLGLAVYAYHD